MRPEVEVVKDIIKICKYYTVTLNIHKHNQTTLTTFFLELIKTIDIAGNYHFNIFDTYRGIILFHTLHINSPSAERFCQRLSIP